MRCSARRAAACLWERFTQNAEILAGGTDYMWIVTVFSLGLFMSVTMERVLQVTGKTVYQMISQMTGAW